MEIKKEQKPTISVIMPVYNTETFLKESIESILNQTFKDFEFIIINDGSTDNSLSLIKEYANRDSRIKIIDQENKGIDVSLNTGLKIANGKYIARMDSDDISSNQRFEKQLNYIERQDAFICGTWASIINKDGNNTAIKFNYPPKDWMGNKIYLLRGNPLIHPSVLFKIEIYKNEKDKNGNLYKKYSGNTDDYELWSRLIPRYKTVNLQEFLIKYRVHPKQITILDNYNMRITSIKIRLLSLFRILFSFFNKNIYNKPSL